MFEYTGEFCHGRIYGKGNIKPQLSCKESYDFIN